MKKSLLTFTIILYYVGIALAQNGLKPIKWNVYPIKNEQQSAAFVNVHDLDKDGKKEVLLTTLREAGNGFSVPFVGALRAFNASTKDLTTAQWTEKLLLSTQEKIGFVNEVLVMDVDEDGQDDLLLPTGFLTTGGGSLQWLAGGDFTQRRAISPETSLGSTGFFWHQVVQFDLDGDGKKDLITTSTNVSQGPPQIRVEWYKHLGNGQFEQHIIAQNLGGVFIVAHDFDNDGDMDLGLSQFFGGPSLMWLEQLVAPTASNQWKGNWQSHVIDATTGLGYAMKMYDIDVDGEQELVYCNHNNQNNPRLLGPAGNPIPSGVYWFELPSSSTSAPWEKHTISEGFDVTNFDFGNPASQGSPGIFDVGDIDGNGLPDIVLPGDGAKDLYLLRQQPDHSFTKETIATGTMFGMAKIVDWDGDGSMEVIAAMHNFPADAAGAQNPPPGHIKVYDPVIPDISQYPCDAVLYPVPIHDNAFVRLALTKAQKVHIKVVDKFARVVYQKSFNGAKGENILPLDLSNLSPDIYLVNAQTSCLWKWWRVHIE